MSNCVQYHAYIRHGWNVNMFLSTFAYTVNEHLLAWGSINSSNFVWPCHSLSGWPSGLRRCVQVAVWFSRRGFESHFWQIPFVGKEMDIFDDNRLVSNNITNNDIHMHRHASINMFCGLRKTAILQTLKMVKNGHTKNGTFPSPQGGSNSRPLVYKTSALATELKSHFHLS